jgi:hypothetical protein
MQVARSTVRLPPPEVQETRMLRSPWSSAVKRKGRGYVVPPYELKPEREAETVCRPVSTIGFATSSPTPASMSFAMRTEVSGSESRAGS